jgi:hypothetical protein
MTVDIEKQIQLNPFIQEKREILFNLSKKNTEFTAHGLSSTDIDTLIRNYVKTRLEINI